MTVRWLETSLSAGHCQLVYMMKTRKLLIWKRKTTLGFLCFLVKLSYPPFILFCFLYVPILTPSPSVCKSSIGVFLPFICFSVRDRLMLKQSIRLSAAVAGSLGFPATLKCGESNSDTKSCGLLRSGPRKNPAVAVRRNTTALVRFWSWGWEAALSRVLALTDHETDVWSETLST